MLLPCKISTAASDPYLYTRLNEDKRTTKVVRSITPDVKKQPEFR